MNLRVYNSIVRRQLDDLYVNDMLVHSKNLGQHQEC